MGLKNAVRSRSKKSVIHRVRLMPAGWGFLSIIGVTLLAAWNTGNNLYYLVLSLLVSSLIVAWLIGRVNLGRLTVSQFYPHSVYQHETFPLRTIVANRKRLLPSFMIAPDLPSGLDSAQRPFVVCAPARRSDSVHLDIVAPRRGLIKTEHMAVRSTFPVGLFEHGMTSSCSDEVLVYPAVRRIHPSILAMLSSEGDVPARRRGNSRDFYGVREYSPGDDSRLICWKLSAKHNRLMLREFERHEHRGMTIVFDGYLNDSGDSGEIELFEKGVSFCASLAWHYLREGYEVGLRTASRFVPPRSGRKQVHRVMEVLALIEPADPADVGRTDRNGSANFGMPFSSRRHIPVFVTFDKDITENAETARSGSRVVNIRDLEF